jgi:hypothetical protein
MGEQHWTPIMVEERFEEAAFTLRRLPSVRVQGYVSTWPAVIREFYEAYGSEPARIRLGPPTAAAITRMDEALEWLRWLDDPEDVRVVWARACGLPWKLLCYRFGAGRTTLWRRWSMAMITIAARLRAPAPRMPPVAQSSSAKRLCNP